MKPIPLLKQTKMNNLIQRFEYSSLKIPDEGFEQIHWKALGEYEQLHGKGFFTLFPDRVKFAQYVGVIQVNELTIEILPKVDAGQQAGQKATWQKFLLDMLQECHWMQTWSHQKSFLQFKYNNILEAYLGIFLNECRQLLRQGLIKKYRKEERNHYALKGKLLFGQQVRRNLVHQERFFTRHTVYDKNNVYNRILSMAIQVIPKLTANTSLIEEANQLLFDFPEVDHLHVTSKLFERLPFDRKTEPYKEAISIAAMLLLNYRPDISTGNNHILALLFDMNDLWEEFIYRQLLMAAGDEWEIGYQNRRTFWESSILGATKIIKPDLVIRNRNSGKKVIVDTKWKMPDDDIPADADLKQMFAYNEYWNSDLAVLLYPSASFNRGITYHKGSFKGTNALPARHECSIAKVSVLDKSGGELNRKIGRTLLRQLEAMGINEKQLNLESQVQKT